MKPMDNLAVQNYSLGNRLDPKFTNREIDAQIFYAETCTGTLDKFQRASGHAMLTTELAFVWWLSRRMDKARGIAAKERWLSALSLALYVVTFHESHTGALVITLTLSWLVAVGLAVQTWL